jgi:nucleoside-diphosphate-sugar epimerase
MPSDADRPSLVIGCGYLGLRVARAWRDAGRRVVALTRSRAEFLRSEGIEPLVGDVLDPDSLRRLPEAEAVVYAVGLDRTSGRAMRDVYVTGLANVLAALPRPGHFVYVSSTSVYGQTDGSAVNESSPTEPVEESGRVVLEAEATLRERLPSGTILRFAGIYGPGRILRKAALLKGEPLLGDAEKWLNLIHVDDGARAVLAAQGHPGRTLNVADDTPVTRRDFYTHAAELLNAPPARFEPGPSTRGDTNRRIENAAVKSLLKWSPQFADFRQGLADAIRRST